MQPKAKKPETRRQSNTTTTTTTTINNNNQQLTSTPFSVGSEVEVSSDEDGFRDAWYLATVIPPPPTPHHSINNSNKTLFVEYKNLLSEEKGSTFLKEFVNPDFVRPKPPILDTHKNVPFNLNQVVDAYFQDGWWTGVVTQVLDDWCYRVFFSNPPHDIEFRHSHLRVHKNWVLGHWVEVLPQTQKMRGLNFSPGTAVEVNIVPDFSCDVWFPATFIKQVTDDIFVVEYKKSKESGLLKAAVGSLHIRPTPPHSSSKVFNLLEKVDAFYDCHWLSGVVTKILGDGKFIVYFKQTKKEKELCHTDLRLHMEWTNGKWVHSSLDNTKTSNSGKKFGHAVNGGYKEKIRSSAGSTDIVKENVEEEAPLTIILKNSEEVFKTPDSEISTKNGKTRSNKRIKLTNGAGDSILLKPSKQLNKKAACDVVLSPEPCNSNLKPPEGSTDQVPADLDTVKSSSPGNFSLKQAEDSDLPSASTENKDDNEEYPLPVTRKRGRPPKLQTLLSDPINGTPHSCHVGGLVGSIVLGLAYRGKIRPQSASLGQRKETEPEKAAEDGDKRYDTSANHDSIVNEGGVKLNNVEVTNLKRKRGRPPKVLFRVGSPKTKEAEFTEETKDAVSDAKSILEKHSPNDVAKQSIADAETAIVEADTSVVEAEKAIVESEKPVVEAKKAIVELNIEKSLVEVEKPIVEIENPIAVVEPNGIGDSTLSTDSHEKRVRLIGDHFKCLSDIREMNTRSTAKRTLRKHRKISNGIGTDDDINVTVGEIRHRRGRQQRCFKNVESPTEDAVDASTDKVNVLNGGVAGDVDKVVGTSSNGSDDDRPLSAWFDGAHNASTTDGRVSLAKATRQCDVTGERQDQNKKQCAALPKEKEQEKKDKKIPAEYVIQDDNSQERKDDTLVQSTAIVPMNIEDLPFVKTSVIWEMIESMEVFKQIPQKPHFRPLYNCKVECREGLAIGNMVTFSSLVERASRLQVGDPQNLLDGYLEALLDLEEMGFNVEPVRRQLNTLLIIKSRHEQVQNTTREIESQIMECIHEKSKVSDDIVDLDKKIAELNEKRALAVSSKEMKDAEIALLQSSVDAVKGSLESAEKEFEKVTASLW